jgi:predicted molibdopterin-dependent oxidoreductase YjgC
MQMRIRAHPILDFTDRGPWVRITVNGQVIDAKEGEPVAAAMLAAGLKVFRRTPKLHSPRGVYCAIGRCTDCVMRVDGTPSVRTCVTPARDGMVLESQDA